MSEYITEILRNNEVLLLFLVLAIGFIIGGIEISLFCIARNRLLHD